MTINCTMSVLMPVYNGGVFLCMAIESILNQSYKNIELIIINDGSTDNSEEIIKQYSTRDSRIRSYSRENRGLIETLNEGLSYCTGKYIFRMDQDDIATLDRVKVQKEYLDKNENVLVCGTWVKDIDESGNELKMRKLPTDHLSISIYAFFRSPLIHPSCAFRNNKMIKYNNEYKNAEDFELWHRLISMGYTIGNIPFVGLYYRQTKSGLTLSSSSAMKRMSWAVRNNYIFNINSSNNANYALAFNRIVTKVLPRIDNDEVDSGSIKSDIFGYVMAVKLFAESMTTPKAIKLTVQALKFFLGYGKFLIKETKNVKSIYIIPIYGYGLIRLLALIAKTKM